MSMWHNMLDKSQRDVFEKNLQWRFLIFDGKVCMPIIGGFEPGHEGRVTYVLYQLCNARTHTNKGTPRPPAPHARAGSVRCLSRTPAPHARAV